MSGSQINLTLGTAGHIDHGKTALVKSLTGCDTDRLKEEKERGMSIDLGYAPCTIAGTEVGLVDVPGHEHFVKTMVAGASGMDGVILVVAADDGVMPQTREHLDILTLLGVHHGLVAMTKVDRVASDHRELARAEIAELVRGTFLEGAPILPVSNVTAEGFDTFFEALLELIGRMAPRRSDGLFRLPLDRAFSATGYGTIVAGIPLSGSARIGDPIELLPHGIAGRIKRIEVYGRASDVLLAGQCAAVNVGHWDRRDVNRGDVIATPGFFSPEEWYVAELRLLTRGKLVLKSGAEVKFHTGTSEVAATVYPLEAAVLQGGYEGLVQLRTKAPVVAAPGDRFILRSLTPVQTVGGGVIVEAVPQRLKRTRTAVIEDLHDRRMALREEGRWVEYCLRRTASPTVAAGDLAVRTKLPLARVETVLSELVARGAALALSPNGFVHRDTMAELAEQLTAIVAEHHRQSPASPGIARDSLRQAAGWDRAVFDAVAAALVELGQLVEQNGRLALRGHRPTIADAESQAIQSIEALFLEQPFAPPAANEVAGKAGLPPPVVQRCLQLLCEHGRLVRVDDILFHRQAIEQARQILVDYLEKEGKLESVKFKYLLDTTRKYAIPLLDYFDRVGVTGRSGHTRFLKARPRS